VFLTAPTKDLDRCSYRTSKSVLFSFSLTVPHHRVFWIDLSMSCSECCFCQCQARGQFCFSIWKGCNECAFAVDRSRSE